jgi:hypothetical protein
VEQPRGYWEEARWPWWAAAVVVAVDVAACAGTMKLSEVRGVAGRELGDAFFGPWGLVPRLLFVGVFVAYVSGHGSTWRGLGFVTDQPRERLRVFATLTAILTGVTVLLSAIVAVILRAFGHAEAIQPPVPGGGGEGDWIVTFVVGLPVVEELLYRSVVHGTMRRWMGPWGAIFCGGLLFGVIHYCYGIPIQWVWGYAIAGMMLAWMYERTGSVLCSWLLHALANLTAAILSTRTWLFE